MNFISTCELEKKVQSEYSKLKTTTQKDGIYHEMRTLFQKALPTEVEGIYVYSDDRGYHYVISERGEEYMHNITDDLFEISYLILKTEIFEMAINFELKNRIDNQDSRRLMFMKRLELLGLIGENYRKRDEITIDEILKNNPYDDETTRRVLAMHRAVGTSD